jgi:hypothetical protein
MDRGASLNAIDTPEAISQREEEEWISSYEEKHGITGKPLITGSGAWKLVAVASTLPQPFTLSDLVLACWRGWPDDFGLAGAERASASDSRVRACLYGARGLVATGWIDQDGKSYRIGKRAEKKP